MTKRKKPRKVSKEVLEKKVLIGTRIKELRGKISQDAIASAGGTSRRVVGEVERASTDYRIESLLAVIHGLEEQLHTGPNALVEKIVFAPDSMESDFVQKLVDVFRHGDSNARTLVMSALDAAAGSVRMPLARTGPTGRSSRSA